RRVFMLADLLVSAFELAWVGRLVLAAHVTVRALLPVLLSELLAPFLFWTPMIGFVVYVHHTHAAVHWHAERGDWTRSQPFVSTTVHLQFPLGLGAAMHHIMEHTAHHVDMTIPLYRLRQAQARLEEMLPGRIVVQRFS